MNTTFKYDSMKKKTELIRRTIQFLRVDYNKQNNKTNASRSPTSILLFQLETMPGTCPIPTTATTDIGCQAAKNIFFDKKIKIFYNTNTIIEHFWLYIDILYETE